jgi:two-component SAPR family response regulator
LLEQVELADFKTIFVTAFDAYAIRAFEVNALDYLLKLVNPERLKRAIEKLFKADQPNRAETLAALSNTTTACFCDGQVKQETKLSLLLLFLIFNCFSNSSGLP